jgi:FKBP-type peptidyl-prolyl cis-trans isomerase (trigger factor)
MKEDHQIAKGDLALVRLEFAAQDGSPLEVPPETLSVMVGAERPTPPFQPVVAAAVEGLHLGKDVTVSFTWPEGVAAAEEKHQALVGKALSIKVKAEYGRTRVRPELNPEFVAEVAGLETVDQYLAVVRERLESGRRTEAEDRHAEAVMTVLLAANPMPLPERLFVRHVEDRLAHIQEDHAQRGTPAPDAEARTKVEAEVSRAILKDALTSAIMKLANIEPHNDQIAEKVHAIMGTMDQKNPRFSDMYMNAVAYYTSRDLDAQVYAHVMKLAGSTPGTEAPAGAKPAKAKKAKAAEVEVAPQEAPAEATPEAPAKAPKKSAPRKPKAPAAE